MNERSWYCNDRSRGRNWSTKQRNIKIREKKTFFFGCLYSKNITAWEKISKFNYTSEPELCVATSRKRAGSRVLVCKRKFSPEANGCKLFFLRLKSVEIEEWIQSTLDTKKQIRPSLSQQDCFVYVEERYRSLGELVNSLDYWLRVRTDLTSERLASNLIRN